MYVITHLRLVSKFNSNPRPPLAIFGCDTHDREIFKCQGLLYIMITLSCKHRHYLCAGFPLYFVFSRSYMMNDICFFMKTSIRICSLIRLPVMSTDWIHLRLVRELHFQWACTSRFTTSFQRRKETANKFVLNF